MSGRRDVEHWSSRAACLMVDPELFFAPDGERASSPAAQDRAAEAKATCLRCPVRRECLTDAITSGVLGIWGGTDEDERRGIQERLTAPQAPVRRLPAPHSKNILKPPTRRVGCGTPSGGRNHSKHKEQVCDDCQAARRKAWSDEQKAQRDALVAEVQHLAEQGASLDEVARAAGKKIPALERYLQRAERHDLLALLKRAA